MRKLSAIFLITAFLGCCGPIHCEKSGAGSSPEVIEAITGSNQDGGLQRTYTVVTCVSRDEGKSERVVSIVEEEGVYRITREIGLDAVEYLGLEVSGFLGFGDPGEGGIVGIYKRVNDDLSGLWIYNGGKEIFREQSKGAKELRTAVHNFTGTWIVTGSRPDGSEPYEYPMTLKRDGDAYKAVVEFESGDEVEGWGLAADNVLVLCFDSGDSKILKVLEFKHSRLEGKCIFSYLDDHVGEAVSIVGNESASRR